MNALVPTFDPSVPAYLQQAGFLAINQAAVAGLSSGAPPRLSFRGSRFRFVAADGTETPVTENNGVAIDVIVVSANPNVSKFYYDKAYDPNADDMAPACFSDNGIGPSVRANKPQSLQCQGCPNNAWGSKVTPQGTQTKACSDVKKIAVVPVSNVNGPAYMLGIPAASLKTWTACVSALQSRNIPVPALVIRIGFDATAEYPKLTFSPTAWISQEAAAAVQDLFGSDEVNDLVGLKDTPVQNLAPRTAAPNPTGQVSYQTNMGSQSNAKQAYQPQAPAAPYIPPATQAPFVPPAAAPTPPFLQSQVIQPVAAVAPVAEAAPTPRRRGRPAAVPQTAPQVPLTAPAPPSNVGAMLDQIMGMPK